MQQQQKKNSNKYCKYFQWLNNAISSTCCVSPSLRSGHGSCEHLPMSTHRHIYFFIHLFAKKNDCIANEWATWRRQRAQTHFWKWIYLTWKFLLLNNSVTNNCEIQCIFIACLRTRFGHTRLCNHFNRLMWLCICRSTNSPFDDWISQRLIDI